MQKRKMRSILASTLFSPHIKILLLGLFVVLAATIVNSFLPLSTAHAAVPYQMNFQGRLNDSTGAPMPNGTYNMRFRIFSAVSGGTALWTETHAVSASQGVTVTTGGLFSVQLGSVTSLPNNIFDTSSPLYLEVELPTPGTATSSSPSWTEGAMGPRNPIESSPYAINSDLLDGLDSTAFAASTGGAGYIQNQNSGAQTTSNFWISGTGKASTLQAASFDTTSAGALALGGTNATSITIGSVGSGNYLSFTAGGGLVANGTARHTKTILLPAEYTGAVLDATADTSCSSANSGTMTAGYDSTNRMNYYNWTSTSGTAQCYDVVVQIPIPSDFAGWSGTPDIRLTKDSTGTAAYAIRIIPSSGTDANYDSYPSPGTLSTSWANMATSALSGTYTAGDYMTVKIRMSSTSSANVKLGNIKLTYYSLF